ncbi:MAG: GDSL-type esterase/lipase family protein [Candidatus Entotheonellia bacterium]
MPHGGEEKGASNDGMWKRARHHRSPARQWALVGGLVLWGVFRWGVGGVLALPVEYFALGDSVASGHGLADDGTACRQSMLAYPWLVFERLQGSFVVEQFDLLACSGTTTATLDGQVSEVLSRLSGHPTLLTLTVGANDFGWSDVFAFAQDLCTPDDAAFRDWVEGVAHTVEDHLVGQLGRVLAYPQVEVILTDYYNPTNTSGAFWERVHPRCLFVDVYERSEHVVHTLNAAITRAWQRVGSPSFVQVATVHDAFHSHEAPHPWCGTALPEVEETWIQYPTDPDSNSTPVGGDCFHPNRAGAEQYAEAVTALVPPDLALPLRLRVNDANLAPGDPLTLTVTITPESTTQVVDLYVALQFPDQTLWFLPADGSLTPEVRPLFASWAVAPFRGEVFRDTFSGGELPGNYVWLAVFTEPGTGTIVGTIAQAPFTFSP